MVKEPKDSKTYNMLWPLATLEEIDKHAAASKISRATFVKKAVAKELASLNAEPEELEPPSAEVLPWDDDEDTSPPLVDGDYTRGVDDACDLVAKNPRLSLRMASGGTMGGDIAAGIRKELGV